MSEEYSFDREDVLQWLGGREPSDIRAVLMVLGKDPDCPNIELDRDPEELLDEIDEDWPGLDILLVAIEEALAVDRERLEHLMSYEEPEADPDLELPDIEDEPEDD
jgi:hypothetical protein